MNDIIQALNKQPQTYKTLLKEKYGRNTQTEILKRRMTQSDAFKTTISYNGKGFYRTLYYSPSKEYYIFITEDKTKRECYYGFNPTQCEGGVDIEDAYLLTEFEWKYQGKIFIPKDQIKRFF